jgi:hypothetical protein
MQSENRNKLIEVFAGTLWQAEIVKGLLEANNIQCTIIDETIGAVISPYSPAIGDVIVAVNNSDKKQAIEIIEKNSIK